MSPSVSAPPPPPEPLVPEALAAWPDHLAEPEDQPWGRYLLFRRSRTDPAEGRQAYLVYSAQGCPRETLVRVAGTRGCIESAFEAAKQETGLDDYEVRSATGWYRHVTLALWALALLAVLRGTTLPAAAAVADLVARRAPHPPRPGLAGLEALPRLGGPALPLPAACTAGRFTTVILGRDTLSRDTYLRLLDGHPPARPMPARGRHAQHTGVQALAANGMPLPPTPVQALARVQEIQVQYVDEKRLVHRIGHIILKA